MLFRILKQLIFTLTLLLVIKYVGFIDNFIYLNTIS